MTTVYRKVVSFYPPAFVLLAKLRRILTLVEHTEPRHSLFCRAPALSAAAAAELAAIADPNCSIDDVAHFKTRDEMLASEHRIDAVANCTLAAP